MTIGRVETGNTVDPTYGSASPVLVGRFVPKTIPEMGRPSFSSTLLLTCSEIADTSIRLRASTSPLSPHRCATMGYGYGFTGWIDVPPTPPHTPMKAVLR